MYRDVLRLLGTHLSLQEAGCAGPRLVAAAVVFGAAALLVMPSLALLYVLHGRLEGA